jgi:hypothetical protein
MIHLDSPNIKFSTTPRSSQRDNKILGCKTVQERQLYVCCFKKLLSWPKKAKLRCCVANSRQDYWASQKNRYLKRLNHEMINIFTGLLFIPMNFVGGYVFCDIRFMRLIFKHLATVMLVIRCCSCDCADITAALCILSMHLWKFMWNIEYFLSILIMSVNF